MSSTNPMSPIHFVFLNLRLGSAVMVGASLAVCFSGPFPNLLAEFVWILHAVVAASTLSCLRKADAGYSNG